ncbi:MAG: hypothetical protein SGJ19_22695 [Planctomycetia bacterium]|nr:hypothetical protein [Planctomycetia bacterium]
MYGVPADLPVQRFVGDFLTQVRIGKHDIQFAFGQSGTVSVWGHWELVDSGGNLVDCAREPNERDAYRVHAILNQAVSDWSIDPPHSFSITFESGHRLKIFDDSPQYESFSIEPGNFVV